MVEIEVEVEASEVLVVKLEPGVRPGLCAASHVRGLGGSAALSVLRQPARPGRALVPASQRVPAHCRLTQPDVLDDAVVDGIL